MIFIITFGTKRNIVSKTFFSDCVFIVKPLSEWPLVKEAFSGNFRCLLGNSKAINFSCDVDIKSVTVSSLQTINNAKHVIVKWLKHLKLSFMKAFSDISRVSESKKRDT